MRGVNFSDVYVKQEFDSDDTTPSHSEVPTETYLDTGEPALKLYQKFERTNHTVSLSPNLSLSLSVPADSTFGRGSLGNGKSGISFGSCHTQLFKPGSCNDWLTRTRISCIILIMIWVVQLACFRCIISVKPHQIKEWVKYVVQQGGALHSH